jgi:hypothetical protein
MLVRVGVRRSGSAAACPGHPQRLPGLRRRSRRGERLPAGRRREAPSRIRAGGEVVASRSTIVFCCRASTRLRQRRSAGRRLALAVARQSGGPPFWSGTLGTTAWWKAVAGRDSSKRRPASRGAVGHGAARPAPTAWEDSKPSCGAVGIRDHRGLSAPRAQDAGLRLPQSSSRFRLR